MKKNNRISKIIGVSITTLIVISSFATIAIRTSDEKIKSNGLTFSEKMDGSLYEGYLRVYIVEPVSRWDNKDRNSFHFGFLDFAFDDTLSIEYLGTFSDTFIWNGDQAGYGNIKESNIMVIAAVFDQESYQGYADPPFSNPFEAHYVDASAGAIPSNTGYNTVTEDFTHTVFVEEAVVTWCPHCPAMAETLNSIYESEDYPFYFLALVADENQVANNRLKQDYNQKYYPTAFFDGGKKVLVGGYDDESYYRTRIESCGQRDVHKLNLTVSVEWMGNAVLEIEINIVNNEKISNSPPDTPTIEGPTSGEAGKEYEYRFSAIDVDSDDLYYCIDWDCADDDITCIGPYASGKEATANHSWCGKGNYTIRAKARDINEAESDWATLEVSMPMNRQSINTLFLQFFNRFLRSSSLRSYLIDSWIY